MADLSILKNKIVTVVLIGLMILGGIFVISRFGEQGSGTGGTTGPTKPPVVVDSPAPPPGPRLPKPDPKPDTLL